PPRRACVRRAVPVDPHRARDAACAPDEMNLHIRPLRTGDEPDLRRVFRGTIALGHPVSHASGVDAALRPYERLCLEWYLGPGREHASVLHDDERVVGYALVCVDPEGFARWQRRAAARFTAQVAPRLVLRRYPASIRRFYRLRLRDGWELWRHSDDRVAGLPHAHFNATAPGGLPGRLLADHVDGVVAAAGFESWYGEMNARGGRRVAALGRWGAEIVSRRPNATLSWLTGEPVDRLTVLRHVVARRAAA
ncbi:MAG TPA: hypothetical protein VKH17_03460, partial [Acidimicrobiia bacterium]|nr:hypothetical protein [Acidimicrobiia bacterium]